MGVLSCTAVGTNSLTLSPLGNQAIPLAYANGFRAQFVAVGANTGVSTANVAGLGAIPIFKDTSLGPVVLTGGELINACAYQLWYDAALNSGSGGFHLVAAGGTGGSGSSGGGGAWQFIQQQTASGSSLQFVAGIGNTQDLYELDIDGLVASVSTATIQVQVSTNAGTSWVNSGYTWITQQVRNAGPVTSVGSTSDTGFVVNNDASSGNPTSAVIRLTGLNGTSGHVQFFGYGGQYRSTDLLFVTNMTGAVANSAQINAIQVIVSTGTISSGSATLYALALTNGSSSGGGGGSTFTTAGVVGDSRNFVCSRATTTTLTITASEVIVKTGYGSSAWLAANLSKTLNFATTGLNGLDTGAIAASKFYGIYVIYNPTTNVFGTLASLNLTTPTTLPSGFTAYALMAVVPTNSSSQIVAGYTAFGRECTFNGIAVLTNHADLTSLTSVSVAAAVPSNATFVSGYGGASSGSAETTVLVAGNSSGAGIDGGSAGNVSGLTLPNGLNNMHGFVGVPLLTPQTVFAIATVNAASTLISIYVTGYTI